MAGKRFPTSEMLKAREKLAKRIPEQVAADEAAMRADLEKYYKNMRPLSMDVGEVASEDGSVAAEVTTEKKV